MIKIKAKKESVRSMNLIVPIDGMITIDGNGEVEVSEQCAELLTTCTSDWEALEPINDENSENDANDDNNDGNEDERDILEKRVKKSNAEELKDICKEMEFPEEEWEKLSKKNLQKYIMDKYDALEEDDEYED